MKKIVSLLLVAVMLLGLVACGAAKPAETQASETTAAPAPVETAAPATEAPTEAALVVDTCILKEADDKMLNTYTAIAVNPEAPFTDADGNAVSDVAVNTAGADALIQNFVGVTVVDRGVHVGAGQGDGGVAVAADRVGDGAERDALRLGGLLGCGAAVDDGGGVGQQILRLGILRRGKDPACQRQIRP